MKTLNVTYDTVAFENGEEIVGETCMNIEVEDTFAEVLLDPVAYKYVIERFVETMLKGAEGLKGRRYVKGSIKAYREV